MSHQNKCDADGLEAEVVAVATSVVNEAGFVMNMRNGKIYETMASKLWREGGRVSLKVQGVRMAKLSFERYDKTPYPRLAPRRVQGLWCSASRGAVES